jgi:hypothetical protein
MADTTPPKNNKTDAPDIDPRDGSSYYGTLSKECCDMIFAFKAKAIAEDKLKRLIKATLDNFEQQISDGTLRTN